MRIFSKANRIHISPWLVPMIYAVTAIVAGMVLPRLENLLFPHLKAELSIDSAIALYSSIASGMMALTGIVFSLTFLMVQFSATAYSPRLVMWIARDPILSACSGRFQRHLSLCHRGIVMAGPGQFPQSPLHQRVGCDCAAPCQRGNVYYSYPTGRFAADQPHAAVHRQSGPRSDRQALRTARSPFEQATGAQQDQSNARSNLVPPGPASVIARDQHRKTRTHCATNMIRVSK